MWKLLVGLDGSSRLVAEIIEGGHHSRPLPGDKPLWPLLNLFSELRRFGSFVVLPSDPHLSAAAASLGSEMAESRVSPAGPAVGRHWWRRDRALGGRPLGVAADAAITIEIRQEPPFL